MTIIRITANPDTVPVIIQTQVAGYQGPQGAKGDTGAAATVTAGTTTTGAAGSSAAVTNSGSSSAAVFNFTVPAGAAGSVTAGTTTTGAPGTDAAVVNSGSTAAAVLDFTIPRGDVGETGATGPAGAVNGQVLYFDTTASDLVLPVATGTTYACVNSNPDTITRSSGSFVTAGFIAGMKIKTTGFVNAANNGTFVVAAVAADKFTLATIHALTAEAAGPTVAITTDRERVTRSPAAGVEVDESQSIVLADGDVSLDSYCTPTGMGATEIPAGIWTFHAWSWVSSTSGTTTAMKFRVLKVSTVGVETTLFTTAATTITATSLATVQALSVAHTVVDAIALLTTDRIVVRVVGTNSTSTARVLHFVYQGSTHASHVETTLQVASIGVPPGGAINTALVKASSADYNAVWATIDAPMLAPSVALTGTPTAPTATPGTGTTQLATTAFVQSAVGNVTVKPTGFAWYDGDSTTPDAYWSINALGVDDAVLTGNTGYTRQTTGTLVDPQAQSRMRRCALKNDGSGVYYYLDCDDSAKIAGTWSAPTQTGWVRVHEGVNDPVRPVYGQATTGGLTLRKATPIWVATTTYAKGARVSYGGSLWDSLSDANLNITPAAGSTASVVDGTDGQIMVEVPAFYYRQSCDTATGRNVFAVAFDTATYAPFPNLAAASTLPASVDIGAYVFNLHPAFTKGGVQRPARYIAAYRATATDTGNNGTGTLLSKADGSTIYAGTISRTNFRTKARNRNSGLSDPSSDVNNVWNLLDYQLWHAVQVLFLTEYRTFYAQAVIGGGNNGGGDYQKIAGRSNPLGNATGNYNSSGALIAVTTGDTDGVAYRGIEDLYGSQWSCVDGENVQNTASGIDFYTCNNPHQFADGTATNYVKVATAPNTAGGWAYAKTWVPGTLIPAKVGGSTTTYSTDAYLTTAATSGWYAVIVGGSADFGAYDGIVALPVNGVASDAGAYIGAALAR